LAFGVDNGFYVLDLAHARRSAASSAAMDTVDSLRERFARSSDERLLALLKVEPQSLTPEARLALGEEIMRRGLRVPPGLVGVASSVVTAPDAAIQLRYPKAPSLSRLLALIVDGIVSIAPIPLAVAVASKAHWFFTNEKLAFGVIIAATLWSFYYSLTKDGRNEGQSIGKEMFDLMVVNVDTNEPCSNGQSAGRAIIWVLLSVIPIGWFIEPIVALASEDGRRLGDQAAHTQVIDVSDYRPIRRLPNP